MTLPTNTPSPFSHNAPSPAPYWADAHCTVHHADSLAFLQSLPSASVDAVVTDPPYSSGGMMRSDRAQQTSAKYTLAGTRRRHPEFYGDNRDQRGFAYWSTLWLAEAWRVTKPGGSLLCFTDWRQLPTMTDAVQAGGWVWRGIAVWDKTEGVRPQRGWFRAQAEYVLTASHGNLGKEQDRELEIYLPGVFRENVRAAEKQHITGKPLPLMQRLLQVVPPGGVVLDPFAGSGTTLLAARSLGLRAIGCELSAEYCAAIRQRLDQEQLQLTG